MITKHKSCTYYITESRKKTYDDSEILQARPKTIGALSMILEQPISRVRFTMFRLDQVQESLDTYI